MSKPGEVLVVRLIRRGSSHLGSDKKRGRCPTGAGGRGRGDGYALGGR